MEGDSPRQRKSTNREAEYVSQRRRNVKQNFRVEYLVHWKGTSSSDDSWEPVVMLAEQKHLIKEYLRKNKLNSSQDMGSLESLADEANASNEGYSKKYNIATGVKREKTSPSRIKTKTAIKTGIKRPRGRPRTVDRGLPVEKGKVLKTTSDSSMFASRNRRTVSPQFPVGFYSHKRRYQRRSLPASFQHKSKLDIVDCKDSSSNDNLSQGKKKTMDLKTIKSVKTKRFIDKSDSCDKKVQGVSGGQETLDKYFSSPQPSNSVSPEEDKPVVKRGRKKGIKRKIEGKFQTVKRRRLNTGQTIKKRVLKMARKNTKFDMKPEESDPKGRQILRVIGRRRLRRDEEDKLLVEYLVQWKGLGPEADTWEACKSGVFRSYIARALIRQFLHDLKASASPAFAIKNHPVILQDPNKPHVHLDMPNSIHIQRQSRESKHSGDTIIIHSEKGATSTIDEHLLTAPKRGRPKGSKSIPKIEFESVNKLTKKQRLSQEGIPKKKFMHKNRCISENTEDCKSVASTKSISSTKSSLSSVTSSDEGVLYSLTNNPTVRLKGNIKSEGLKRPLHLDVSDIDGCKVDSSSGTPDTDPEISFKHSPSKRMLLKDSIRPKSQVSPVPPSNSDPFTPATPSSLGHPSPCKTPPSSPGGTHNVEAAPSQAATAMAYMEDIVSSPTGAAEYKNLMKNLQSLHAKKKKGSSSGDQESVERRVSVRSSESAFRYKEIVVKKCPGYTQIWLCTQTKAKNALNPKVFSELQQVLHNARYDDSRLVLLSGSSNIFCSGIDLHYLIDGDRKVRAKHMAEAIKEFVNCLINFPKPIMVAVNGPAVGLGMAILPLCDIVYASDKATFSCPYSRLCQTPEGAASYTFPTVMGTAMANEILLGGRRLTAIEANQVGLVSQVLWPTSLMQEVIPRLQQLANTPSPKALEASKLLIRTHTKAKLLISNESECVVLAERWTSPECGRAIRLYVEEDKDLFF